MDAKAPRLPSPVLMLVTDRHLVGGEDALIEAVSEAVDGGVNVVQLREKDLGDAALFSLAGRLRNVIASRALLVVNGADLADGAHLPEGAPMISGKGLVGRSVHSLDAARRAEAEGADYVIFGPVFETASHADGVPSGIEGLGEVVRGVRIPVIAIGGITSERVGDVMDTGAAGIAVISAILGASSPREATEQLARQLRAKVA
jgi:thiamine-phosphate pyrophosphorylase